MDNDNRNKFFSDLFDGAQQKAIQEANQLAFEERVIKFAFNAGGCKPPSWGRLANMCRAATNQTKLNFAWFNSEFTRFPGILCGERMPFLHKIIVKDVFNLTKPLEKKNKLLRALLKSIESFEIDVANQFVFAFPMTRTLFTAHNLTYLEPPETEISVEVRYRFMNRFFIIEPAKVLFARIGAEWAQDLD